MGELAQLLERRGFRLGAPPSAGRACRTRRDRQPTSCGRGSPPRRGAFPVPRSWAPRRAPLLALPRCGPDPPALGVVAVDRGGASTAARLPGGDDDIDLVVAIGAAHGPLYVCVTAVGIALVAGGSPGSARTGTRRAPLAGGSRNPGLPGGGKGDPSGKTRPARARMRSWRGRAAASGRAAGPDQGRRHLPPHPRDRPRDRGRRGARRRGPPVITHSLQLITAEELAAATAYRRRCFRTRMCTECGCYLRMTNGWEVCDPCVLARNGGVPGAGRSQAI